MRSKELWIILLKSGCRLLKNLSLHYVTVIVSSVQKISPLTVPLRNITSLLIGAQLGGLLRGAFAIDSATSTLKRNLNEHLVSH
jgi:hypothetical protein